MKKLISLENGKNVLETWVSSQLAEFEKQVKFYKEQEEELKKKILEEMEKKNIIKIESDDILINYISASERETFDTKKFREEHEEMYDDYVKFTTVKPSIRIRIK